MDVGELTLHPRQVCWRHASQALVPSVSHPEQVRKSRSRVLIIENGQFDVHVTDTRNIALDISCRRLSLDDRARNGLDSRQRREYLECAKFSFFLSWGCGPSVTLRRHGSLVNHRK
jgi:hypothetical protein